MLAVNAAMRIGTSSVRRLYRENPHCPKATFAEQIAGLPGAIPTAHPVAVALAGSAGARLLSFLHYTLT
ncbi:hypothetical protein [Streptomyces sp. NPDC054794]